MRPDILCHQMRINSGGEVGGEGGKDKERRHTHFRIFLDVHHCRERDPEIGGRAPEV
jgi:hypothetical protein